MLSLFTGVIHQPSAEELGGAKGTSGLVGAPTRRWRRRSRRWCRRRRRRCGRVGVRQAPNVQRPNGLAVVRSTAASTTAVGRRTSRTRRRTVTAPPGSGRVGWTPSGKPGSRLVGRGHRSVTHRRVQGRDPKER